MVHEIVTINVGQAGIQLGSTIWNQYHTEHNINYQGNRHQNKTNDEDATFLNFYEQDDNGICKARTLMIDSEPQIIEKVKSSKFSRIYHSDCFLSDNKGSGGCFTAGRYVIGNQMIDTINNRLRQMVENCDNLQGFIMNHSVAGGTGSGLGTLILEQITNQYDKKNKMGYHIYPFNNNFSNNSVEPYNSILTTNYVSEHSNISLLFDNRQIYNICSNKLRVQLPIYSAMNSLIAKIISCVTYALRFQQDMDYNIQHMVSNTVPFPRLQFLISSLSPLIPCDENNPVITRDKDLINGYIRNNSMIDSLYQDIMNMIYSMYGIYKYDMQSLREISMDLFNNDHYSVKVPGNRSQYAHDDLGHSTSKDDSESYMEGCGSYIPISSMDNFLSCYINYSGDIQSKKAEQVMKDLRYNEDIKFVEWCPTGLKSGYNKQVPGLLANDCIKMGEKQSSMIGGNVYIGRFFNERIGKVCDRMYSQRAFFHWFVRQGMEEQELLDARENVRFLNDDYLQTISEQYS